MESKYSGSAFEHLTPEIVNCTWGTNGKSSLYQRQCGRLWMAKEPIVHSFAPKHVKPMSRDSVRRRISGFKPSCTRRLGYPSPPCSQINVSSSVWLGPMYEANRIRNRTCLSAVWWSMSKLRLTCETHHKSQNLCWMLFGTFGEQMYSMRQQHLGGNSSILLLRVCTNGES